MYHSVDFGNKNTWDDWHLIPSSRPLISPPPVNEKFVDVPGRNGQLDLTEWQLGFPTYGSRTGSMEFIVANDWWEDWTVAYTTISNYLHGKRMRCVLEDDPTHYYEGRFKVNAWKSDKNYSTITIDYTVDPYKHSIYLVDDIYEVSASRVVDLHCGAETICPKFKLTDGTLLLSFEDDSGTTITHELVSGDNTFDDLWLKPLAFTEITFTGTGTVQVEYREGDL